MQKIDDLEIKEDPVTLKVKADAPTQASEIVDNTSPTEPEKIQSATTPTDHGRLQKSSRRQSIAASIKSNAKISEFFSVVRKQPVNASATLNTEYFQPFFVKPNQALADYNCFVEPEQEPPAKDIWKGLRALDVAKRRVRCLCVGFDSKPIPLVMKLFQFHTNYHPPYFGTFRKSAKGITGRCPFRQDPELDYEYDSDDDWGEDEEILDAESITDSEDERDDIEESSDMLGDDDSNV